MSLSKKRLWKSLQKTKTGNSFEYKNILFVIILIFTHTHAQGELILIIITFLCLIYGLYEGREGEYLDISNFIIEGKNLSNICLYACSYIHCCCEIFKIKYTNNYIDK